MFRLPLLSILLCLAAFKTGTAPEIPVGPDVVSATEVEAKSHVLNSPEIFTSKSYRKFVDQDSFRLVIQILDSGWSLSGPGPTTVIVHTSTQIDSFLNANIMRAKKEAVIIAGKGSATFPQFEVPAKSLQKLGINYKLKVLK